MNEKVVGVVFLVALIFILAVSGCISPPKEAPLNATTTTKTKTNAIVPTPIVTTVPTPVYVNIETPYPTPTVAYWTITPIVSPIKDDYVVIYSIKNQAYSYNKSAVSFDLKNPPMQIDFIVSNTNITRNMSAMSRVLKNEWTVYNVEYPDPVAYFEVTVREKSTNNIILQDGFGQSKQYGTENRRHLTVYRAGNYIIEFDGNKLTANVDLSVKREGNINQSVV